MKRVFVPKHKRNGEWVDSYTYNRRTYKLKNSPRKDKDMVAIAPNGNKVHFGDPNMREFPGTKREDNFCSRTYGQKDGEGNLTRNDPHRANFYNRRVTWQCRGKRSANR